MLYRACLLVCLGNLLWLGASNYQLRHLELCVLSNNKNIFTLSFKHGGLIRPLARKGPMMMMMMMMTMIFENKSRHS